MIAKVKASDISTETDGFLVTSCIAAILGSLRNDNVTKQEYYWLEKDK